MKNPMNFIDTNTVTVWFYTDKMLFFCSKRHSTDKKRSKIFTCSVSRPSHCNWQGLRRSFSYRVDGGNASLGGGGRAHSSGEGDGGGVVDHTAGGVGLLVDDTGGNGRHRGHGHREEHEGILGQQKNLQLVYSDILSLKYGSTSRRHFPCCVENPVQSISHAFISKFQDCPIFYAHHVLWRLNVKWMPHGSQPRPFIGESRLRQRSMQNNMENQQLTVGPSAFMVKVETGLIDLTWWSHFNSGLHNNKPDTILLYWPPDVQVKFIKFAILMNYCVMI